MAANTSRLYPAERFPYNGETALDHAVSMYSINNADGSDRGGEDYNRIYLGFDDLAKCIMRNYSGTNPDQDKSGNMWVPSDDIAGPHPPFTQREMIFWYRAWYDLNSNGPQWHHWAQDSDMTSDIDSRLGVCGVRDPSLTELTIAFDYTHNSDPLATLQSQMAFTFAWAFCHSSLQ
jgi:hypothetical protein